MCVMRAFGMMNGLAAISVGAGGTYGSDEYFTNILSGIHPALVRTGLAGGGMRQAVGGALSKASAPPGKDPSA